MSEAGEVDRDPRSRTAAQLSGLELEHYVEGLFAREDPLLEELRREGARRGFPVIQVPPVSGRFLHLLVAAIGARRIVEVGTLLGYSAIWMARALPEDGRLITLEREADRAALAREFLERAGVEDRVEVRVGDARESLSEVGPSRNFDLVFVDADKTGNPEYAEVAARLLRSGGLLVVDNALWRGAVLQGREAMDPETRAVADFNRAMATDERFLTTILTVGDGLLVGVRR